LSVKLSLRRLPTMVTMECGLAMRCPSETKTADRS
jgi:hypothetical protein